MDKPEDSAKEMAALRKKYETGPKESICPFMSTPKIFVHCTDRCKFFKSGRKGYECIFQELGSISWNTRRR